MKRLRADGLEQLGETQEKTIPASTGDVPGTVDFVFESDEPFILHDLGIVCERPHLVMIERMHLGLLSLLTISRNFAIPVEIFADSQVSQGKLGAYLIDKTQSLWITLRSVAGVPLSVTCKCLGKPAVPAQAVAP